MLKIYINNEEVIANQNFTIQKHMLNTPSVILNNVCPKTWCDEKDYITNFYHPLDYSKCKIVDETFHPYDPGITTTINQSATLNNVDTTKLYELTKIEGNTTQSGTPTPTTPQPINVVSGRQEISVVGKNLFDISNSTPTKASFTFENDILTVQATGGNYNYIQLNPNEVERTIKANAGKTLKFRLDSLDLSQFDSTNDVIVQLAYSINGTNSYNRLLVRDTSSPTGYKITNFVIPNDTSGMSNFRMNIFANNSATATSTSKVVITKPMFYFGEDSSYKEYKGQSYEINLGKNLLRNSLEILQTNNTSGTWNDNTYTHNGVSFTYNENGSITVNGEASANTFFYISRNSPYEITTLEAGTYYLTSHETTGSNSTWKMQFNAGSAINVFGTGNNKEGILILTENKNIIATIIVYSGYNPNGATFYPMISKTKGTNYAPYKTPIELCKIGDYQDKIYKENGTWYLEKNIGKVVLDGSENWQYVNNVLFITNNDSIQSNGILIKSNYLSGANSQGNTSDVNTNPDNSICLSNSGQNRIYIKASQFTSADNFKTWLSTHNTTVYYVLATPTTTEITDTELISQLNAIELLEGLNNISITSGDLPGIMTIHYNFNDAYTTEDLLFCGVVKNSGKISLNPREPHYTTLQVLDFKDFLSSGETLDFVIYQKTILEAIQQVISTVQDYGFILGNVNILNPNEIIGAYSTKDKTAYDVFNYIADITQSRWTTRMIDENTVAIDFYDPTLMPQGTEIDYTNAYFNDKLIDDMKYSYGTNNYRNKQVMISNQVYSNISQTQTIVANGYQTQFPTEQPIGKINSITSNGIPLTFATFNEKDMGYVADFYYTPGENYFESEDLRSTGEVLIIDYVAIVEGRQVITNSTEIDRINESTGRKGIVARYETRNDATTSTELQKIGESYIKYKGTPEIVLTIQSRKSTWEVGQRVQFNAPIDELDTEYMVRSKKINYIANQQENENQLFYTYELVSSFNSETEINYFDNQRAKASGNIGEGEYISRNIDIESTAEIIFYETTTTEVVPSGDNELNAILNSPFIS